MYDNDPTLERRLKAKDKTIEELLTTLKLCKATLRENADTMSNAGIDEEHINPATYIKATEVIRKIEGE